MATATKHCQAGAETNEHRECRTIHAGTAEPVRVVPPEAPVYRGWLELAGDDFAMSVGLLVAELPATAEGNHWNGVSTKPRGRQDVLQSRPCFGIVAGPTLPRDTRSDWRIGKSSCRFGADRRRLLGLRLLHYVNFNECPSVWMNLKSLPRKRIPVLCTVRPMAA